MKIGSTELSVSTIVCAAIILALLLIIPSIVWSRWGAMRESWHRGTIMNAQVEGGDAIEGGIAACKVLIAATPSKAAPRLHLGCLLARAKNYKEAREAFEGVKAAKGATDEEVSIALTGAGCAACLDGAANGKPAHYDEAERLFLEALANKRTPDAAAALALLRSWREGGKASDAEALVNEALTASPAPSPGLLEELYKLRGSQFVRAGKPVEAANAFLGAKAINPANVQMDEAARLTKLAALNVPGKTPAERRAAIESIYAELEKYGSSKAEALLAIGMAWHGLKGEKDYAEPNGPFMRAGAAFKQMLEVNAKDPRPFKNFAALQEERVAELVQQLSVPITGLNGECPQRGFWLPDAPAANGEVAGPAGIISKADQDLLGKINVLLRDELLMWERFLTVADVAKEDKIDARLRLISCYRRKYLAGTATKPVRRDGNGSIILDAVDLDSQRLALQSATELATLDESGHGHYELALIALDKGDLSAARTALLESAKRGYKSDGQAKMLAALDAKAVMVDVGPVPGEREFGNAPLVRAAFQTPLGPSALKGIKVSMDGHPLQVTVYGSQVLYMMHEAELTAGAHAFKITAADGSSLTLDSPEIKYLVDKDPPTWSVTPAAGNVKTDAVFSVSVADPSGIDWTSLSVGMKSSKTGNAQPFDVLFVKEGHYSHSLPSLKVKSGEAILKSPFQFTAPNALPPGDYKMWIEVKDQSGNKLKDEKAFSVGK